jgi:hypothetical protein
LVEGTDWDRRKTEARNQRVEEARAVKRIIPEAIDASATPHIRQH